MKRTWWFLGLVVPLAALKACKDSPPTVDAGPSVPDHKEAGVPDADGGNAPDAPDVIPPCGACSYAVGNKDLTGTLLSNANTVRYPIANMKLTFYGANGVQLGPTITNLSPSGGVGDTSINQTVSGAPGSGVARVKLEYTHGGSGAIESELIPRVTP